VDGLATRVQRPAGWATSRVLDDAKRQAHAAQGVAVSTIHGDLLWCDGGWPGSCHEQELLVLSGLDRVLDAAEVAGLVDRGFRGMAKGGDHWHAPVGDRRTKDRLTGESGRSTACRRAAGAGGAVDRASGQRLGAASLARAGGPGAGCLAGRRRAGLPRPVAASATHLSRQHGASIRCYRFRGDRLAPYRPVGLTGAWPPLECRPGWVT
jgi:hypothetical protein